MALKLLIILLLNMMAIVIVNSMTINMNLCDDWIAYNKEKCYKVIPIRMDKVGAVSECSELHPKALLITIESVDEQVFVNTILATYSQETDKVWTGMTNAINGANFQNWHDDEPVSWGMHALFNNRFQEVVADYCVQISTNTNFLGRWYSEPCVRRAYALCARRQEWTIEILSDAMENMTRLVNSQQLIINDNNVTLQKLNELNSLLIDKLESDSMQRDASYSGNLGSVPIGFVYIQLPNQSEPIKLWPQTNWTDVTAQYLKQLGHSASSNENNHLDNLDDKISSSTGVADHREQMDEPTGGLINVIKGLDKSLTIKSNNLSLKIWKRVG